GSRVAAVTAVSFAVATAPAQVSVPNVVGQTHAASPCTTPFRGLTLGTVTMQSSTTVASGTVISESPTAGTSVAKGSAVNLVVSSGPAQVAVPNEMGRAPGRDRSAITGGGLTVGTVTKQSSTTGASG